MANRYFKYGDSGGIGKVIDREINSNSGYYNSLKSLLKSEERCWIKNPKIEQYGYDGRLGKDVYMVIGDHGGYKEQFVCYFIECYAE